MTARIIRGIPNPHKFISCPICGKQLICTSRSIYEDLDGGKEELLEYWCDECNIDVDIMLKHDKNSPLECGIYEVDNF